MIVAVEELHAAIARKDAGAQQRILAKVSSVLFCMRKSAARCACSGAEDPCQSVIWIDVLVHVCGVIWIDVLVHVCGHCNSTKRRG